MALHPPSAVRPGEFVLCRIPQESYRAYVPAPLPPVPPLALMGMESLLERANQALGRLDGITLILPEPDLFLYMYIRKEAVLSSQIEGTQSSLADLLLYESNETPGVPLDDVREVSRYVAAMNCGLNRLHAGFPLSLRLIREIHAELMTGARGGFQTPGEFRTTQNWIGGSRPGNAAFVPPPPDRLTRCLTDFEKFLHSEGPPHSVLVRAALMHVQFATIHPFLDGNGRLGRLLITFLLCAAGVLRDPSLYLSLYLKRNRQRYYELLQKVRLEGVWEEWIQFFLQGVEETATQAVETARQLNVLIHRDRAKVESLGRAAASALKVYQYLQRHPIAAIATTSQSLSLSIPTVAKSLDHLIRLGIITEPSGRQRGRLFTYQNYLDLLSQGTEPLAH